MAQAEPPNTPGFNPLYAQVRQHLVSNMLSGRWTPGMALPPEPELAAELGVSQGTVRKALDALAKDNLIVKQQGRGTFVAEPHDQDILFKFYRLTPDANDDKEFPDSTVIGCTKIRPEAIIRDALKLDGRSMIWCLERVRVHRGDPVVLEKVSVPASLFPDLGDLATLPNNLYRLYAATYGQIVARVSEKLKAAAAVRNDKTHLGCRISTPLLAIDRTAYGLDDTPLEYRQSRCLTEVMHYRSDLK